jgi:hypothetical protein
VWDAPLTILLYDPKMNPVKAVTGSDAVILSPALPSKNYNIPNPSQQEFRLTLTITWEEYRAPGQRAGTLWLAYNLAKTTAALPGIGVEVPVVTPGGGTPHTFEVVTTGSVGVRYNGVANAHVWLSYFAEFA